MKLKTKLLFLGAFLVIALPLVLTGNAGAGYLTDGAVQDGVTGGWITPNDMVCIVGLHTDGTLDIADGVTNSRECIYLNKGTMNGGTPFDLTTMTTSDQCTKAGSAGNDGAKHSWATSICVDGSGNGISLKDLDRTSAMCTAKGGTWVTTGKCVAYGRQFKGQDDDGTPLAFGTKGTSTADAGFCYAPMNMTSAYPTEAACPVNRDGKPKTGLTSSDAYDYSWPTTGATANKCIYAKGIKGYPASALTKADGSTYGTGSIKDLSVYPTMGECLANGGSWNNWVGQPASTTTVATTAPSTIPVWDFTRQAPETTQGCLHCHSTVTQYNGPAERWKDSYLKHGHKNMLRKVTPGKNWAGPNEHGELEIYTEAATGEIDFGSAAALIGGIARQLLYIFGDWMAPAPAGLDVIVNMNGSAKYNGTGNYSCAACHTTGWSNSTSGLCSLSSKTTQGDCTTASGTWYPSVGVEGIGTPGFTPAEPLASFPDITFPSAGKWDVDGIQCPRCHNVTAPRVVAAQIAASAYPSTHATSGGMGSLASGVGVTNLCFGCHQSIAKTDNGLGADKDLNHPENIPVKNTATAPDYLPEFDGHVIGNSFLNSPHARFTGKIVPNALGKYDLEDTTGNNNGNASKYSSAFQGYTCWQSATSSSPAKTMIVDGVIKEIKTKSDCETLYGVGAWRSDNQGTCATCHDVHNSFFVEETKEAALRKVCPNCHINKSLERVSHPKVAGGPLDVSEPWEACVNCHMPKATASGFPMHLWRINTDVDYRTFPTAAEFGIGATATKKIANASPDGSYTNAVWVDVDYACGQCHGGSFGPSAANKGPYLDKATLSGAAQNMHMNGPPVVSFTTDIDEYTVTLTDTSIDESTFPANAVTVQWGDGTSNQYNAGDVFSHTYATDKTFQIVYSVKDSDGLISSKKIKVAATFSLTANFSPSTTSDATFTLLGKNGKTVIKTGAGTSSYVFSGLKAGTYKVRVQHADCTFDGDGVKAGDQNPISVVVGSGSKTVTFIRTPHTP